MSVFFFFNDTATTEIYTLSLHDALPIWAVDGDDDAAVQQPVQDRGGHHRVGEAVGPGGDPGVTGDDHAAFQIGKSTRLNSSHANISYAVFCLKKKKTSLSTITTASASTS